MTLENVKNELFGFFIKNSTFKIKDISKLDLPNDDPQLTESLVIRGLDDLIESEAIVFTKGDDNPDIRYWTLKQDFTKFSQTVTISGDLACQIADLINFYCEMIENDRDTCSKLSISERDIENLYLIAADGLKKTAGGVEA